MADIKLYYFSVRGRAEAMRLVMAAAGKKFEDIRLTGEQWGAEKAKSPYGQMPFIEYKGKRYGESKALTSFVARECGLEGKTSVDALRVDEVFCLTGSLLEALAKAHFEKDADAKAKLEKQLADETIPKYLGFFQKLLKESGTGFFVGTALTLADLSAYNIMDTLLKANAKCLDSFPDLQKLRKDVEDNKNVSAYLASRPASDI
ncbi:hypothetical protein ACOMHN_055485 [Nucella lapillus]